MPLQSARRLSCLLRKVSVGLSDPPPSKAAAIVRSSERVANSLVSEFTTPKNGPAASWVTPDATPQSGAGTPTDRSPFAVASADSIQLAAHPGPVAEAFF